VKSAKSVDPENPDPESPPQIAQMTEMGGDGETQESDPPPGTAQRESATPAAETAADSRWKTIPYSRHGDCPKAAEDAAWDGPAQVKKAEVDDLMLMCVFEDADSPDTKSGYKLPHHNSGGKKPTVVWRGVAAGMGVLLGARGGVKGISAETKKSGYNHLKRHYAQFDKEAPALKLDYTDDELRELHDAGRLVIPGVPDVAEQLAEARTQLAESHAALQKAWDRMGEIEDELTAAKAAGEELQDQLAAAEAARAASDRAKPVSEAQLAAFRVIVRAVLTGDPEVKALLDARAQDAINQIRKGRR